METLTRNPFTDHVLFSIVTDTFQKGTIHRVISDYVNGALDMYWYIRQLDPYENPVTKHEFRLWLLDNGFEEKQHHNLPTVKVYDKEGYMRMDIDFAFEKLNLKRLLYAEIKLKYGTR